MVTHSSILAWRIAWTEEPGGLWSMGSQRVGHDWVTNTHTYWVPTSSGVYHLYPAWDNFLASGHTYRTFFSHFWCWEGLWAGGEGDNRGWDGWMASLTRWKWVSVNSESWWWTGRPGVLRFMGSQRVGHNWATDLIWSDAICHTRSDCLPVGLLHQPGSNSEAGSYPPPVLGLSTDPDLETVLGKAHLIALPVGPSHARKFPSR